MEKRKHFSLLNILIQMAYVPSIKEVVIHSAKEVHRAEDLASLLIGRNLQQTMTNQGLHEIIMMSPV